MSVANQKRPGHQPGHQRHHKRGDQKPITAKITLAITEDHRNEHSKHQKHVTVSAQQAEMSGVPVLREECLNQIMYSMMYCRTRKRPGNTRRPTHLQQQPTRKHEKHTSTKTRGRPRPKGPESPVICLQKEVIEHDDINGTWCCTTTGENNLSKNCDVVHLNSQDHRNLHQQRRRWHRPAKNCNCGNSAIRHCPTPNTCCYQQRACRQRVQDSKTTWEKTGDVEHSTGAAGNRPLYRHRKSTTVKNCNSGDASSSKN